MPTFMGPVIGMISKPDLPSDVATRWIAYLLVLDFDLRHIRGVDNVVADGISRAGFVELSEEAEDPSAVSTSRFEC
ncbi:hypothetical protein GQ54DRAFT_314727 [Martensiomyces pterosporus]|nr:hypothetical protein GQ54DRAFT_314727 [Martensiomyces pterosporus]